MTAKRRVALVPGLIAAAALALSGCQTTFFATLELATEDAPGTKTSTHAYDPAHGLSLDLYCPAAEGAPMLVFFYGGSWENGERGWYAFVGQALAARGVAVAIPDYRNWPDARFPTFMDDAARAVAWSREHARDCGADPSRTYVGGHSAGAQIAALLATDARYLDAVGMRPRDLAGVVGIAGPYDFLPITDATLKQIFGPVADHPQSQPVTYVDGDEPPFLLLHGTGDHTVWLRNSERLAAKLEAAHVPVELKEYDGIGHVRILAAMSNPDSKATPTLQDVVEFLTRNRSSPSPSKMGRAGEG